MREIDACNEGNFCRIEPVSDNEADVLYFRGILERIIQESAVAVVEMRRPWQKDNMEAVLDKLKDYYLQFIRL